jgi:hypothetical protein
MSEAPRLRCTGESTRIGARRDEADGPGSSQRLLLFGGLALVLLMLVPPGINVIDGVSMFYVAKGIATGPHLWVPCAVSGIGAYPSDPSSFIGTGGHCYSGWYPLLSFVAAPLAGAGELLGKLAGVRGDNAAEILSLSINALATAGAATVTAALARKLGATRRGAVGAACAFAFGTEALTYSRTFYAEPLSAILVASAVWGLTEQGRRRQLGLLAIALAVVAKPQMIVVGPALAAVLAVRRRSAVEFALPLGATAGGIALYMMYNWARFAAPLHFGGATFAWHPVALGLLTISPGRGLLWSSPVVVLGVAMLVRRRAELVPVLCIVVSLAILVIYIGNPAPYKGEDWGSRYLLPTLPLLCAPLGALRGRLVPLAAMLSLLALVNQIPTTVSFYPRTYVEYQQSGVDLTNHRWSPRYSPLVTSWPAMVHELHDASITDVRTVARRAGPAVPHSLAQTGLLHLVALWWWLLPVIGIPWWIGLGFSLVVLALGALLIRHAAAWPARAGPPRIQPFVPVPAGAEASAADRG